MLRILLLLSASGCTLLPFDPTRYDADGDGLDWDVDCQDDDPTVGAERVWYPDSDGDGLGDYTAPTPPLCAAPSGTYVENGDDCNDLDAAVGKRLWYADVDGDGYGDPDRVTSSCVQPDGWVADATDCNDTSEGANPSRPELCGDLLDNDCDDSFDEAGAADERSWYRDSDGDSYGDDQREPTRACSAPDEGDVERGGDCDDGDPDVHPDAAEVCGNVVDDDCDGLEEPDCGVTSGVVSSAMARIEGAEGSYLGWSAALLDSVDGDDFPDLLLGAYGQRGAVVLIHGPVGGDHTLDDGALSLLTVDSVSGTELLGWSVGSGGDLTGDGDPDLLFGAPGLGMSRGAVYILPGPLAPGAATTDDAYALTGSLVGDFVGGSVAGLGDGALLVGAPQAGLANFGAAYLVQGPITGSGALSDVSIPIRGEASGGQAGAAVAPAGDVDGDGVTDVVIGAPYVDDGDSEDAGAVYLVLGPVTAALDLKDADLTLLGESKQGQAGLVLAPGGDIYQFQESTLLVGAPTAANLDGAPAGRSYVLSRQTLVDNLEAKAPISLSKADAIFLGDAADDEAATIAPAGDLDGDNRDDVAIGAPGTVRGRVYVWHGSFSLQGVFELPTADAILQGQSAGDGLGFSLAGGQDLDRDGYEDLLIGAWGFDGAEGASPDAGAAYVIRGGPGE